MCANLRSNFVSKATLPQMWHVRTNSVRRITVWKRRQDLDLYAREGLLRFLRRESEEKGASQGCNLNRFHERRAPLSFAEVLIHCSLKSLNQQPKTSNQQQQQQPAKQPTTNEQQQPTTNNNQEQQPSTTRNNNQEQATSNQQPTNNSQQTTNNKQPITNKNQQQITNIQ